MTADSPAVSAAERRGSLRVYLGAARGVGKSFALVLEGRRRLERGADVVIGAVDPHGRSDVAAELGSVDWPDPLSPSTSSESCGAGWPIELDVEATLKRRPAVVLVDDLARINPPGGQRAFRWQDVHVLLDAGIDVVSTINIDEIESLCDVAAEITGRAPAASVPDWLLRSAQIQLVDQTPESIRRRLAHGNIYPPEEVGVQTADYFGLDKLGALRELALRWLADRVDEELRAHRTEVGSIASTVTSERVVVAVSGAPGGDAVLRRAGRIAQRLHAELLGVYVRDVAASTDAIDEVRVERRRLLESLGGTYHEVASAEVADGLIDFALTQGATQVVIGSSRRSRWEEFTRGSIATEVLRRAPQVDLHVAGARPEWATASHVVGAAASRRGSARNVFGRRRLQLAWVAAVTGPALLTAILRAVPERLGLAPSLLAFLALVVTVAVAGGLGPATLAAVIGFALANFFFTVPVHTFSIRAAEDVVALSVFIGVALIVGSYVSRAARRTAEVSTARSHAETLASLAGAMSTVDDPIGALLERLRSTFGATSAGIYRSDSGRWALDVGVGDAPASGTDLDLVAPAGEGVRIGLTGVAPSALDSRLLAAFGASVGLTVERHALREAADQAYRLAEVDELRSGLLSAVSHDLRTPLAVIKANTGTLRRRDLRLGAEVTAELLTEVEAQADRLTNMVTNLMDLGRLQLGATQSQMRPVELGDVVDSALASISTQGVVVDVDVADDLPRVLADPPLLERVIANLLDNACKWSPPDRSVTIQAAVLVGDSRQDVVAVRVSDRGPGVGAAQRESMFEPFQRVGDSAVGGTGLGLAVVRGFCDAMGATVSAEDTPGGGLSMTVTLAIAR